MPIMIEKDAEGVGLLAGGRLGIGIFCDYCRERLRPEAGGRVLWPVEPKVPYLDVTFLHHDCVPGFQTREGLEDGAAGMGLEAFVEALRHNVT